MRVEKILESFEALKRVLRSWAIMDEGEIKIIDPPFTITISKRDESITFTYEGRDVAILTRDCVDIEEGFEEVVEEWCTALTSLGFKRYLLK